MKMKVDTILTCGKYCAFLLNNNPGQIEAKKALAELMKEASELPHLLQTIETNFKHH